MDEKLLYEECFFYDELLDCGAHSRSKKNGIFTSSDLDNNMVDYMSKISVKVPETANLTEKELIANRSGKELPKDFKICAKHRFNFGIYWSLPKVCLHPHHKASNKKCKGLRSASWETYNLICKHHPHSKFPIGGTVCPQHRDYFLRKKFSTNETTEERKTDSNNEDSDFEIPQCSFIETDRNDTNSFIQTAVEGVSPVKFQLKSPIGEVSKSTVRYMKRKYAEVTENFKSTLSKKMAPEQEEEFRDVVSENSSSDSEVDETIKEIITAFKSAQSQKMKFSILSLVNPKKYSKSEVASLFGCSQAMVKRARALREHCGSGQMATEHKIYRNRLDINKIDHFLDFLFTTDTLQDVAYGTTTIKYDCGQKHVTAHAVLTALKTHVVCDYLQFCEQIEFDGLSKSSLMRLLNSFNPSQRRFLSGLDNTTADGLNGFSILNDLVKKLDIDIFHQECLSEKIDMGKRYLKTMYKVHCKKSSLCASHCTQFSLSSPNDIDFRVICDHEHTIKCLECESLMSTLDEIFIKVKDLKDCAEKNEIVYDFNIARKHIVEYMRHIIRSVQQEKAKTIALDQTDEETAFWLQDWSQKILPQNYREKQQDYYGKRGISMHVDVFVTQVNGTLKKAVYFTVLESCDQDSVSTLCVSEHALNQFKLDFPDTKKLYVKTDNAGCYSGNICPESRYLMAKNFGIKVLRHDYNEPQRGKDQADRESAVAKMYIKSYLCEGHNIASAKDVYDALVYKGRMKNAKASIIEVNKQSSFITDVKIADIQSYHSVKYEDSGMTFWKYFEIGNGKKIPYSNLDYKCKYNIIQSFNSSQKQDQNLKQKAVALSRKFVTLRFCPEENCTSTFESEDNLSLHIAGGEHQIPKLLTGQDKAKHAFAKRMDNIMKKADYQTATTFGKSNNNKIHSCLVIEEGWALKPKRKITRLNYNQKQFLEECFKKGDETGIKVTAQSVVKMMRNYTENGKKKFSSAEYLTREQVMSFFSRIKGKGGIFNAEEIQDDEIQQNDEHLLDVIENNEVCFCNLFSFLLLCCNAYFLIFKIMQ